MCKGVGERDEAAVAGVNHVVVQIRHQAEENDMAAPPAVHDGDTAKRDGGGWW